MKECLRGFVGFVSQILLLGCGVLDAYARYYYNAADDLPVDRMESVTLSHS
jgi:hypothetical protein